MSQSKVRRRPKLVRQLNQTECALCCCASLLQSHGSPVSIHDLRLKYTIGRGGLNIADIASIMRQEGATPHVFAATAEEAVGLNEPSICFWNGNHYVLVDPRKNSVIRVMDPGAGVSRIDFQEFKSRFSGYAITIDFNSPGFKRPLVPSGLSILGQFARSNVLLLLITLVVALGTALATLLLPQILSTAFSREIGDTNGLLWPTAVLVGMALGYALMTLTRSIVSLIAATAVGKSMSEAVFGQMMRLPYGVLSHRGVGDLLFTLDSVQRLRMLITTDFIVVVVGMVMVSTLLVWLIAVSILAALVAGGLIFLLVLIALASGRGVRQLSLEETRRRAELQSIQVSAISGLESIKTNAMEDVYIRKWKALNSGVQRYSVGLQSTQSAFTALSASLQLVGPILIVMIVSLGAQGAVDTALIVSSQALAGFLLGQVSLVTGSFSQVAQGWALLERVTDILVRPVDSTFQGEATPGPSASIEIDSVTFSYDSFADPVLSDISLKIPSGAKAAFVGRSGSGKSTLGRLIVGLHQPTSGSVLIDGRKTSQFNRQQFYTKVAYVPQNIILDSGTLRENLKSGAGEVSDADILDAASRVGFEDDLRSLPLGLDTPVAQLGQNFSGGQRQRIALARAALKKSRIVVLDEATSSLDNTAEKQATEFFNELSATRVVIAHRLSTVIDADIIFVIDGGKLVEQGKHDELIERGGVYSELYLSSKRLNLMQNDSQLGKSE